MARAVAANGSAGDTSNTSELKFSPPNIKANTSTAESKPSAVAENASKTTAEQVSEQQVANKHSVDTIPRRQGMLAGNTPPTNSADNLDTPQPSAGKPAEDAAQAKWVAKKSTPAVVSPEKNSATSAVATADSKRVVAETFANSMFAPRQPAKPAVSPSAAPLDSAFPLPPNKSPAVDPTAPQYVTNPHTAVSPSTVATTAVPVPAAPAAMVAKREDPNPTPPAMPTRIAKSTVTPPSDTGDGAPPAAAERRSTVWQQPLPIASSRTSYQAYYHRGVVPKANVTPMQMQPSAAYASQNAGPSTGALPAQHFAPLVDAETYRRQVAQQQHAGAMIPVTAPRPAVQGTWLAAYQKLVQGGVDQTPSSEATAGATVRSLSSDR